MWEVFILPSGHWMKAWPLVACPPHSAEETCHFHPQKASCYQLTGHCGVVPVKDYASEERDQGKWTILHLSWGRLLWLALPPQSVSSPSAVLPQLPLPVTPCLPGNKGWVLPHFPYHLPQSFQPGKVLQKPHVLSQNHILRWPTRELFWETCRL